MDLHIPARGSKSWQILCPSWFAVCADAACRVVVLTASKCKANLKPLDQIWISECEVINTCKHVFLGFWGVSVMSHDPR